MRRLLAMLCFVLCGSFPALAQNVLTPTAPSQSLSLTAGGAAQNLFLANEVSKGCAITCDGH
jgi:hypothetical protein